ncbi:MAG: CBS domain-containing protein, partial [Elusimicrobiota bacterium]
SLASIIREMPVDEAVDLMAHLHKKRVHSLYALLPAEKVTQISDLLELSEKIAGSIMNVEFMSARITLTAGQIIEKIKTESQSKETVYYIYIVDENDVMVGTTTLRQLLLVPLDKPVAEFMRKRTVKVRIDTDIKDVAEIFYKYDFTVVPVVDKQNKLRGIVTIKDALEAVFPKIREESEETT